MKSEMKNEIGIFQLLKADKDRVVNHPYLQEMAAGTLPPEKFIKGLVGFYPLVEHFPKFMALNLAKTRPSENPAHEDVKSWLISNIKVEQNHAKWWVFWVEGLGCTKEQLESSIPSAELQAIVHYLWSVNTQGTLEEGVAATNIGIEWATGEWAKNVAQGVSSYVEQGILKPDKKVTTWLKAHADYDDEHPYEAMALVEACIANDPQKTKKVLHAAKMALEYYRMGLDDCLQSASFPGLRMDSKSNPVSAKAL